MTDDSARAQICEIGTYLWRQRLVTANDGNVSIRLDGDRVLCTPSGVSKGMMQPEQLTVVDLEGNQLDDSGMKPSSEVLMHLEVYQQRPDIEGVVHAHPMFATMWAVAGQALDARMLPETVVSMVHIPLANYATPSTPGVPESIRPFVADYQACLLEHHGALTWASDVTAAYLLMERLEFTAEILWRLNQGGVSRVLPDEEIEHLLTLFT